MYTEKIMYTEEIWNGVVPLIGLVLFVLVLAWWAIEGIIVGREQIRHDRRERNEEARRW